MKYEIVDLPEPKDCQKCVPCMRIRLMEMGLINGEKIEIKDSRLGLWMVNVLTENNNVCQTIALRQEEIDKICLKEIL